MDIGTHRTQRCAAEQSLHLPNLTAEAEGACLATVVNVKLLLKDSMPTISPDFNVP